MDSVDWSGTEARRWITVAIGAACAGCAVDSAPDAGTLDPVFAAPAEEIRILSLGQGQTFGELLDGTITQNEQASLLMAFREHASPRRMRAGTEITLRYRAGGDWLRRLDVELNPDQLVRLTRDDFGWHSDLIRTPVYIDTLLATGEIESVLWSAVINNPQLRAIPYQDRNLLIDHLDRVFQWQVDFSRQIRVGDTYRFAFEREVRPDGSMRVGHLLSAELVNGGTPYYAIWFDPNEDGDGSYYDLQGNSVRRAFLLKPLAYRRISGLFTNSRFHPMLQIWRAHRGVDYAADAGTEIMATSDGVVIHRGWKGTFGNTVEIQHPNGFVTRYAHLSNFKRGVNLGTRVKQTDIIGFVGMTGQATGNHLHYEMLKRNGEHMDPLSVDLPAGDPVPTDDQFRWAGDMRIRVALLESIPGSAQVTLNAAAKPDDSQEAPGGAR